MTISVTHTKVSSVPDGADTSLVRPSDWNASHTLSGVGSMAEQNANNVAITGGSINGVSGVVSSVTGTAPVVSSGGTSPAISMAAANTSTNGYLTSTDWNTFNGKGTGDVVGPASSTDNAVARYDSTTGKLIQNSVVTVGDTGVIAGVTELTASTKVVSPHFDAANSAGGQLRNSGGTPQLQWGGGGGNNISVDVATNLNPANAQIDISPTGTGTVRINPATVSSMNNVVIGASTPLAGTFTDLGVTGTLSFDSAQGSSGQVLTSQGSGVTPIWTTPTTGTVTSVSGTAPISSSGGATPAISISQATTSTDGYLSSTDWNTFNGKAPLASPTFTGTVTLPANTIVNGFNETITVTASAPSSTTNFDVVSQSIQYYTSNTANNWTLNVRGNSGTSLNTLMATGQSITITFLATNGSTAYYNSAVTIDGNAITPKWQGGTAPSTGNASAVDIYTYAIIKTGSAAFTVFASITKFA
jgi:hypothetical protein